MPGRIEMEDPITRLLSPPADESPEEREARLNKEADARRVSDRIDEVIRQERDALRNLDVLKMLLLGQSGSGTWDPPRTLLVLGLIRSSRQIHNLEEYVTQFVASRS